MENEKHFYPIPESREQAIQECSVSFLSSPHPEAKKAERTYDTNKLVGMLNAWWDKICSENGLNPKDKKIFNLGYHIIELGKNALEHAGGGEIKVIFEKTKITVVVADNGQGFGDDPNDIMMYGAPGHGLSGLKRYADEFCIETDGVKYAKVPKGKKLAKSGESDIKHGSKITFIKNFE